MTDNPLVERHRRSAHRHREMLVIAGVVILASLSLRVASPEQVVLVWASDFALPPLCLAREWLGVCCPGCGLTRSFVFLADGNWHASWQAHRLGWLLAGLVILQIPYRIHGLCRPQTELIPAKLRRWIGHSLVALLIGNWLIGMMM